MEKNNKDSGDDGLGKYLNGYAKRNHIHGLEWAQHDVWSVCIYWSDKMVKKALNETKYEERPIGGNGVTEKEKDIIRDLCKPRTEPITMPMMYFGSIESMKRWDEAVKREADRLLNNKT